MSLYKKLYNRFVPEVESIGALMNFLSRLTGCFAHPCAENATVAMIEAAYHHHGMDW